ncbi:hypothetical protein [Paenibacillus roseipurpureus]|uniref:CBM-cenC domain-containing protein n=1 Tax=Paenibacillus roseopurpureus TaxID=2918901 RepID=A0AA96LRY0_9BACL|nr:hypothetical protein [Paenibacillus sp. MBLB1832]WNR46126.1 hypothetical protein MJB10_08540 [Paenibacillus sp. MBLB1832]
MYLGLRKLLLTSFVTAIATASLASYASSASAATAVSYTKVASRTLLFVNNPEQIFNEDLGDATLGDKAIYRETLSAGNYRNFYEHVNRSGSTIGYGIQLYNPTASAITITVHGSNQEASVQGGRIFTSLFNSYSTTGTTYTLNAGASLWVMRKDASITNGTFFSGVIDFDTTGQVILSNVAYNSFAALDASRTYMGYIQRIETDGTHEARMYKGSSPYSEVKANNVNFTINNATPIGALAVEYPNYDLSTSSYGSPIVRNGWIANIGPSPDANAITSDMIDFNMPGWGNISALSLSDGEGKYANLGNWGIVYSVSGAITNTGTTARTVSINLKGHPTQNAFLSYRGSDGVWRSLQLTPASNVQYYSMTVPAGSTVNYDARFILGGPSAGDLQQSITVNN